MNVRTTVIAAASGLAVLTLAGAAQAAAPLAITGLYNTGVGADYNSTSGDAADLHWTLTNPDTLAQDAAFTSGANGVWPVVSGVWLLEDATSRWITPSEHAADSVDPRNDGFYAYNLSFNLTAAQAAGASFSGRFSADNAVNWVKLNNHSVTGLGGSFNGWTDFSSVPAGGSAFVAGNNTLTFQVVNFAQNGGNPSGLRVEFENATVGAVPEPATWALMIGGFGLAGAAIRRQRRGAITA